MSERRTKSSGIAGKVRRGAYHTRRRMRRAVARYHRAYHAESRPILAALGLDIMRGIFIDKLAARMRSL